VICVTIACDEYYGAPCALHHTLFSPRSLAWPLFCFSGANPGIDRRCTGNILNALLIAATMERVAIGKPRSVRERTGFVIRSLAAKLTGARTTDRVKE